jgi:hypothetical protein
MWEDDPFQNKNHFSDYGANHISLFEYQQEILLKYPTNQKEIINA